ncbi:MAG: methyltransferase domain-containing protein [Planctomycetes bacterium]|nr:methyltransferase domain-containing protein [Planctomycetota bacterium]
MRYSVNKHEIRTENAAKSMRQASKYIVNWLVENVKVKSLLDFGCGKLRYARHLVQLCDHLGLVDSKVQIERRQKIGGLNTTINDYALRYWPHSVVYSLEEFWEKPRQKYDFVLCANVISAIPSRRIRAKSLTAIQGCLKKKGQLLVVNQYENSYFKKMMHSENAKPHLDGYLLNSKNGNYYYGILNESKMSSILKNCGFEVCDSWSSGQSAFVLAGI